MSETGARTRTTLRRRVLGWFSFVFVGLLVLIGFLVRNGVESLLIDQLTDDLVEEARGVQVLLRGGTPSIDLVELGDALDARITIIGVDGTVLMDSVSSPDTMDDHSGRPEMLEALAGDVGVSRRFSDTTEEARLYVALPPEGERIVRMSVTEAKIASELGDLTSRVVSTVLVVGVLGLTGVAAVSARLVRPIRELTDIAGRVSEGDLDARARRSSVLELDRLGLAVGQMAGDLGERLREVESERRTLELVLGALPDGVLLVEPDDAIAFANPAARALLGGVPDRLRSLAPAALQRMVRQARTAGETITSILEHGSPARQLRTIATPFRGEGSRVLILVADDTDRQRIEAMRRDFVADASHELKTPVAAILASMETLQMAMEQNSSRAMGFAQQIEHSARRLAQIVEDLLDLSRLEASESLDVEISLDKLVTDEVDRLGRAAGEAGVSIDVHAEPITIWGSPPDLALAVRNLCENALRYTDEDGRVVVRVIDAGDVAAIEVEDTGVGIPRRALGRVFERFYRVDVARSRETGGTGLGLAIVKHVAERHGGSVSVTSELGVGSTFRVTLPKEREIVRSTSSQ